MIARTTLLVALLALLTPPPPAPSQDLPLRAAAGLAIPTGSGGEQQSLGPAAMVSVETRLRGASSLRLDGAWARLPARGEFANDVGAYGASLSVVLRVAEEWITPYLLIGIGAYRLQLTNDHPPPYRTTGSVHAGFGIDGNLWGRVNPFIEGRGVVLPGFDWTLTTVWPVMVGVRID